MKQIYTGYQWRPMTEAELEIMCKENIVDEKTDEAQAGDIYEGPNDCPYCKGGDGQSNKALINNCDDVLAYFDGRVLRIETFGKNWDPTDVECSAMYCLKCGRKLEEAE